MAIMTIITGVPAVSQTPPALSSLEGRTGVGVGVLQPTELQDTTFMDGRRTYLGSSLVDLITAVLCTLQTQEIR